MTAFPVYFTLPSLDFLKYRPALNPPALAPPTKDLGLRSLFEIDVQTYNKALDPVIPLTFAAIYVILAFTGNYYNRRRSHKPWAISQTRAFGAFVIFHNVALAIYSTATCIALVRALNVSTISPFGKCGLAGTVDSLCKMHGPRGFGDAVTYDTFRNKWRSRNPKIHLGSDGFIPDTEDLGRIWNEGLAFWGWLFYLSKFYEVVDTAIILAKGRRSSTLQIYHHAGAMLSMWTGIRYMSPPIWMFVMVNSGIHGLMYTYYTLSALGIKIKKELKQTLTVLQIAQFIVGTTYALMHLFVSYVVPTSIAYTVASTYLEDPIEWFPPTTTESVPWLKKMAFLALNAPGLAHNLGSEEEPSFGIQMGTIVEREETFYRVRNEEIHCLDTNGEVFAILLNVTYLLPLTLLFLRFFIKTYIRIPTPSFITNPKAQLRRLSDSASVAVRKTAKSAASTSESTEEQTTVVSSANGSREKSFRDSIEETTNVVIEKTYAAKDKLESKRESIGYQFSKTAQDVMTTFTEKFETTGKEVVESGGSSKAIAGGSQVHESSVKEYDLREELMPPSEPFQTKQPSQAHLEETDLEESERSQVSNSYGNDQDDEQQEAHTDHENFSREQTFGSSPDMISREGSMGPDVFGSAEFIKFEDSQNSKSNFEIREDHEDSENHESSKNSTHQSSHEEVSQSEHEEEHNENEESLEHDHSSDEAASDKENEPPALADDVENDATSEHESQEPAEGESSEHEGCDTQETN